MSDTYADYVTLLANFNGVDGATSYTSDDVFGFSFAFEGTAQLDTAEKKFGTAALLLDGNSDVVHVAPDTAHDFEGRDFTVECWVNLGSADPEQLQNFVNKWYTTTNERQWQLTYDPGTNRVVGWHSRTGSDFYDAAFDLDTDGDASGESQLFDGAWHHVAYVRSGSTFTVYLDGQPGSTTVTDANDLHSNTGVGVHVGARPVSSSFEHYTQGSIDGVRVTNGVARYTSSFTPPTTEPDANDPHFSNVAVLLKFDDGGTDGATSTGDLSDNNATVSFFGNAQIDLDLAKFGEGSVLFDGSGDYVTLPHNDDYDLDPDDWTLEMWVRMQDRFQTHMIASKLNASGTNGWRLDYENFANAYRFVVGTDNGTHTATFDTDIDGVSETTLFDGNWHHVAAVVQSRIMKVYVDGQVGATTADLTGDTPDTNTGVLGFGGPSISGVSTHEGSQDSIRITRGVARYTAEFTPPTADFPESGDSAPAPAPAPAPAASRRRPVVAILAG